MDGVVLASLHGVAARNGTSVDDAVSDFDAMCYVMASLFLCLCTVAIVQLIRLWLRRSRRRVTMQKSFFILTLSSALLRFVFFIIAPSQADHSGIHVKDPSVPRWLFFGLNTIPSVIFFATYSLLIVFWAEIRQKAQEVGDKVVKSKLRPLFVIMVLALSFIVAALMIVVGLDNSNDGLERINRVWQGCFAVFSILLALFFLSYGRIMANLLRPRVSGPETHKIRMRVERLREVTLVTIVCFTCFLARAATVLFVALRPREDHDFLVIGMYFFFVEVLPAMLILYTIRSMPPRKPQSSPSTYPPRVFVAGVTETDAHQAFLEQQDSFDA